MCWIVLIIIIRRRSLWDVSWDMGIIGEMKRDKSLGSSSASSGGNRSSLSNDRPRPLSAFWGGLGSKSSSSSPKSEPVVPKGYKLKHSYGGSTGHLDAYGAGMGGGMRPAVSMPVVAAVPTHPVASPSSRPISNSGNSKHHRQHRNSLPPALIQHPSLPHQQQRSNNQQRPPPSRGTTANSGLTSRMVFLFF